MNMNPGKLPLSDNEIAQLLENGKRNKMFPMYAKAILLLSSLVKIESVTGNEEEIANFIEELINKLSIENITCERVENNLLVEYTHYPNKKSIAFVAHIDTVDFAEDQWSVNPLGAEIKDGRMYGRGTTDVKNGIAMLLSLLENLQHEAPCKNLVFVFFEGEEAGLPNGLTKILDTGKLDKIEYAVVIEPTDHKLVTGCYGDLAVDVKILGKAGHSSHPEDAENAIGGLAKLVDWLHNSTINNVTNKHNEPGEKVISITQANTRNSINVIPGEILVGINYRYAPQLTQAEAERLVCEYLNQSAVKYSDLNVKYNDFGCSCESLPLDLRELSKIYNLKLETVRFWTDIAQLQKRNIYAVNLGPGSVDQAHADDEFLELELMEEVVGQLYKLMFSGT